TPRRAKARTRRAAVAPTAPAAPAAPIAAEPMPLHVQPMLALLSASLPPRGDEWAFEYKWDGVRALAYCDRRARLWRIESRNLLEITKRYPELEALREVLGEHRAV